MAKLVYGSYGFSTPVETILAAGVPTKALGGTTGLIQGDFTHIANNRLRYDGLTTRDFVVNVSLSVVKTAGGGTISTVYVVKNGVIGSALSIDRTIANAVDTGALAIIAPFTLAQNDYIEIWASTTNGDNMTITKGCIVVSVLG